MNKGDIIEIQILSNGMDGEGVAREDGKVVFVPYTLKGERVRAMIKQVKSRYAVASVVKVLEPSPDRIAPDCPHYYKCGGCDMGHITPEYRRDILVAELENNFGKIANIASPVIEFVPCADKTAVRNKLSMPFGMENGKVVSGLYRHNTHVVERVECMLSGSVARSAVKIVCDFANEQRLSVYDERTGKGLLRHLVVRELGSRASVTLVINGDGFKGEGELASRLPDNIDFFVCPNTRRNNVIMGDSVRLVNGNAHLEVNVLDVKAELSPLSFFQVNDYIRDALYTAAIGHVHSDMLLDLYSGIGITSNLAARVCKNVIAVECVPQAVKDADRTALINGNSDRIKNICGNVEDVVESLTPVGSVDVLIDPPRKGCGAGVMTAIAKKSPDTLIYISCNHATMCRDIRVFLDSAPDYRIVDCRMFDMFPGTHHTEVLCVLERAK